MTDLPNHPMSMLRLMPTKAAEVATFSKGLIEAVKNGNVNPLEVLIMLRSLEAISETVREYIQENIQNEADRYSEKSIEMLGAKIEKSENVRYNYASSKDFEWEQLDVAEKLVKRQKSERETFLKSLKEPMTIVNKDTGEIQEIRPPLKSAIPIVKVYLTSKK